MCVSFDRIFFLFLTETIYGQDDDDNDDDDDYLSTALDGRVSFY